MTGVKNTVLLYRASRDGFTNAAFHKKCDGRARTITIIKTRDNYVFGGYTGASWDSTSGYKTDTTAYIFSLRRNGVSAASRYSVSYSGLTSKPGPGYNSYGSYCSTCGVIYTSYTSNYGSYVGIPSIYLSGTHNAWLTNDIEVFQIL